MINTDRYPLAFLPTPIAELTNLTKVMAGPKILIKRDDQTGLAFGGNKTRKLEFLIKDALNHKADTIITGGGIQSNHCRQAAAAAAKAGLRCELLLTGTNPSIPNGNLLLDYLLKATVHWTDSYISDQSLADLATKIADQGHKPYIIPVGGSNPLGALGYVNAMLELHEQQTNLATDIDHIVFASCSGGTQAGMVAGAKLTKFKGKIHGICIAKSQATDEPYETTMANICNGIRKIINIDKTFSENDFVVNYDYLGAGYAIMGELEKDAINLMAKHEAIFLDPVYTGRAFGGLIDMINKGMFSANETILFWHTGGTPTLFAYAEQLAI